MLSLLIRIICLVQQCPIDDPNTAWRELTHSTPEWPNSVPLPNFLFQVGHSTNLLLLRPHERQMYRLIPTVMSTWLVSTTEKGKCYDLMLRKTLWVNTLLLLPTTRRRIETRSQVPYLLRFEAALLFSFKGAGLSPVAASWVLWNSCASVKRERQMQPQETNEP